MAFFSGILSWWVLDKTLPNMAISLTTAFLLASTMSSTDSASVFSILRSKGINLKNNLRPTLELESGSNDPMAYVLVVTLIDLIKMGSTPNYLLVITQLILQLVIGAIAGYVLGRLAVYVINKVKIHNESLYPILLFTFCLLYTQSPTTLKEMDIWLFI